ncbi:peptidoglycan-binding domain 1 protein, putative [Rhizoctonia solani AG-3 Rhs1AP]|uniref:Peptidoglycan-binding domain 1 protein, putative n=2 Tax=Rhizoctonia solani AG-3 TaxID=1086053 RepID=X8JHT9_9AGAM|nr:peptidoglycan-binding domain 1 protein, putative [Rhizoctonia solani AG-3 Rhs1AP]KEP46909.1 putative peptidoglycan-binding domain 1 protein [Rhizoctonia solani 123E]
MGGTPMTQATAQAKLEAAGISASSTGGCTTKSNPKCTSYDGILSGTVDSLLTLKKASGCAITITGGTEVGHASGTYSHANGYKVDIRHNSGIDAYIKNSFTKIENRGDGYPQWKSAAGNIYCVRSV